MRILRVVTSGRVALVVALLALVVALDLPSQASEMIDGRRLVRGSVSGAKVANDTITGADVRESSLRGLLRTGQVAAYGAKQEAPISPFDTVTFTPVVSKRFVAPVPGYILVTGSITAEDDGSDTVTAPLLYRLAVDKRPLQSSLTPAELDFASDGDGESGAVTGVVRVGKGPHTVHLDARNLDSPDCIISGRQLSVLFVPSGVGFATASP